MIKSALLHLLEDFPEFNNEYLTAIKIKNADLILIY